MRLEDHKCENFVKNLETTLDYDMGRFWCDVPKSESQIGYDILKFRNFYTDPRPKCVFNGY